MVSTPPESGLRPTPRNDAAERVAQLGTILGIWAHPDDEVYLSGGVMRLALANGQHVACVTATTGERGTDDPVRWPAEVLGPARRRELAASFATLAEGARPIEHHWLDWPDGGCAEVGPTEAAARIGTLIDRIRPDTVLTFDPTGMTGHPDHRAVARWVHAALEVRPGIRRLDAVAARSWIDQFGEAVDISAFFDDGYPDVTPDEDLDVHVVLDDELWAIKDRALRAHASQVGPVLDHLGPSLWRAFSIAESFVVHTRTHAYESSTKDGTR